MIRGHKFWDIRVGSSRHSFMVIPLPSNIYYRKVGAATVGDDLVERDDESSTRPDTRTFPGIGWLFGFMAYRFRMNCRTGDGRSAVNHTLLVDSILGLLAL